MLRVKMAVEAYWGQCCTDHDAACQCSTFMAWRDWDFIRSIVDRADVSRNCMINADDDEAAAEWREKYSAIR